MTEIEFRFLDDLPIASHGQFQFDLYSSALTNTILNSKTPMTLGIFGDWGTGKTSLMKMIKKRLNNDHPEILTVWFDAWRYENEPNIIVPMLYTVRDEIIASKHTVKDEVTDFLGKFLLALSYGLETSIKTGVVDANYKPKEVDAALKEFRERRSYGKAIYYDMFRYLRDELEKWGVRLVIFIDDLDRCNPEKAIATLETIQLVLHLENIVFVVGASNSTLEKAIDLKYADLGVSGHSFLKKMFPASFTIPPLHVDQLRSFIEDILIKVGSSTEEKETLPNYFVNIVSSNPRETKRIINTYVLMREMFLQNAQDFEVAKLGLFVAIQHEWPRVFRNINSQRREFIRFCKWYLKQKKKIPLLPAWVENLSIDLDFFSFLQLSKAKMDFTETDVDIYVNALSTASIQSLFPVQIRFDWSNKKGVGRNNRIYTWSIWPDVTSYVLDRIEKIIYRLPPDMYRDDEISAQRADGFRLVRTTDRDEPLKVNILVYFKEFSQPEAYSQIIDVTVDK